MDKVNVLEPPGQTQTVPQAETSSVLCHIIGVLENGTDSLSRETITLVENADLIIGAERTLKLLGQYFKSNAELKDLKGSLGQTPEWIKQALKQNKSVVVLASGDPLCHGIAKFLLSRIETTQCKVYPNLSAHQLAFAQLGLAWQQAHICSVHSTDAGEWSAVGPEHTRIGPKHGLFPVLQAAISKDLIAVYTSPENSPDRIARMLIDQGYRDEFEIAVAENLLAEAQTVYAHLSLNDVAKSSFASPNIVVLQRRKPMHENPRFGLDDTRFKQRKPHKGLITKREVRALSLARLQLKSDSLVWDIGAGSGSVGLEAAQLCPAGFVYAIEKNPDDYDIALQNQSNLHIHNYHLVNAKAPQQLALWPDPDAVFIGGSGGELAELIQLCLARLKPNGNLVMNFATFENLNTATETLKQLNANWDVCQIQVSRSRPILQMHRLEAQNPVWVVSAAKAAENNGEIGA